jgi:hypothetical protein
MSNYPLSRKHDIVIQEIDKEILIYDLSINKALCLNETSTMIWQECDGSKSVAEISRVLSRRKKANVSENIIWLALNQFKKDNLLADSTDFTTPFDGLNRREIVKRIGFASLVALPIIAAVVAPTALQAQSAGNCGPIAPCNGSGAICTCVPIMLPGSNVNPQGCPCQTPGDCTGDCNCGSPCTGVGTQGSCPSGSTCNPDGSCSGICPPSSFNFCVGGLTSPFCTSPFDNNTNSSGPCCQCNSDGDCVGSCSNNNAPNTIGVCI